LPRKTSVSKRDDDMRNKEFKKMRLQEEREKTHELEDWEKDEEGEDAGFEGEL
jgi:hypothetical protein